MNTPPRPAFLEPEVPRAPKKQKLSHTPNIKLNIQFVPRSLAADFEAEAKADSDADFAADIEIGPDIEISPDMELKDYPVVDLEFFSDVEQGSIKTKSVQTMSNYDFDLVIQIQQYESGLDCQNQFEDVVKNIETRFDEYKLYTSKYPSPMNKDFQTQVRPFDFQTPVKDEETAEPVCPDAPKKKKSSNKKYSSLRDKHTARKLFFNNKV